MKVLAFGSLLLLLIPSVIEARQQAPINTLKEFVQAQEVLPRERVYIHTDRDWYFVGDRIWFSAYVTAGGYNYLSEISNVLYVELVAPNGNIIERVNVKLEEGRGAGSVTFKNTRNAEPGVYQLRAFTKWAQNFGESYVFTKKIKVRTEASPEVKSTQEKDNNLDVQFMPESGHLVGGLPTRLAFKAIGFDGLSREVSGTIYDGTDRQVASFSSQHNGMGSIDFVPKAGASYYARVAGQRIDLPEVQPEGVVLLVDKTEKKFEVSIQSSPGFKGQYLLFAHVRGVVYHAEMLTIGAEATSVEIPTDKFATGVVHFALLNIEGKPVAERLSFNNNPISELRVEMSLSDTQLQTREDMLLNISVGDGQGTPMAATASVSVFDDAIEPYNPYSSTIKTRLTLESEVQGYVEDPGYYFSDAPGAKDNLDLLMMTQGWRAYDLTNIQRRFDPENMNAPEKGFTVSGRVERNFFGRGVADTPVLIMVGKDRKTYTVTTDQDGRFVISDLVIEGQEELTVKASDENGGRRYVVSLDEQFSEFPRQRAPVKQGLKQLVQLPAQPDNNVVTSLQERVSQNQQITEEQVEVQMTGELDEITVEGERQTTYQNPYAEALENLSGTGSTVRLDERPELINYSMDQILRQMGGVYFVGKDVRVRMGAVSINTQPQPPLIIIDGIRVSGTQELLDLNARDVESITVARSAVDLAVFGSDGAWGAIIVTTRGGRGVEDNVRGLERAIVYGFQQPSNFYAPKYGVNVPRDLDTPDNRITLHWEPLLEMMTGEEQIRFWANDVPSQYRIVLEGITDSGIPFYSTGLFEIR